MIGLIEAGQRLLTVNNQKVSIGPGDLLTFNPLDNHSCEQTGSSGLSYLCLNIKPDIWAQTVGEITNGNGLPRFGQPVQFQTEFAPVFRNLHKNIRAGTTALEKEELFLLFVNQILAAYVRFESIDALQTGRKEINAVCAYLETNYAERLTLNMLETVAGMNKYTLLRTFTRLKGITPYRYLETIRIGKAKTLLEQGMKPADVAQATGFADQSHFSRYFNKFIGLSPGQYQAIFSENID